MQEFDGKTAVVTGASSGIGRAIAMKLAKKGANVVIADIKSDPSGGGMDTHEKIQNSGGNAIFVKTDTSSSADVKELFETALDTYKKVDILVNNAGVHHSAPVTEESEEGWDQVIDVNLKGCYLCCKHAIDQMLEKDLDGKVVNIASIAGIVGFGGSAAYCASKGAIVNLTKEMAIDYGPEGININAVAPGVIRTAMTQEMLEDDETRKGMEAQTLAPRLGEPEDIANAVSFLASEKSSFVMGETLVVDGGWVAK